MPSQALRLSASESALTRFGQGDAEVCWSDRHACDTLIPVDDPSPLFQTFFMGGFECATHRRRDHARIDVISRTKHDLRCAEDYKLLASAGIRTVRDGLRWHLIETVAGNYDWSSFLPMLHAAIETGTQVLWDLCHWGLPQHIDPFSPDFPERFAAFAGAAATIVREQSLAAGVTRARFYCPVNEMSFWAWVGGDVEHFHPFGLGRGPELKRQLVLASLHAMRAVRAVDPTARFLQAEPLIHVSAREDTPEETFRSAAHTASQFESWDMLAGVRDPELGGSHDSLDLIGVNYYWNNQWILDEVRTPLGHHLHRPLHDQLLELWNRYRRPILLSETGAEGQAALGWFGYVAAEVRQAQRLGVPVLGICMYPVMDYPGWDDDRHCEVGLIQVSKDWLSRRLRPDLAAEIRVQAALSASI